MPTLTQRAKQIFVSHSSRDREFVESELIPAFKSQGFKTWYSTADIVGAEEWGRRIQAGLRESDFFAVVLSPNAVRSNWVFREVSWAFENREGRLLPILMASCNPEDLFFPLGSLQYVDYSRDAHAAARDLATALANMEASWPNETLDTQVALLGPSCSGKTVFLTAMYHTMKEESDNYSLLASDASTDALFSAFSRNLFGERRFWPPLLGDEPFRDYSFMLGFQGCAMMRICITRIGVLAWKDIGLKLIDDCVKKLQDSSVIFFTLSTDDFLSPTPSRDLGRILWLLSECQQVQTGEGLSICIIVTKTHVVSDFSLDCVTPRLIEVLNPLFFRGVGHLIGVCPVTLDFDDQHSSARTQIEPSNFSLPVVFAAYSVLSKSSKSKQSVQLLFGHPRFREACKHMELSLNGMTIFSDGWKLNSIEVGN